MLTALSITQFAIAEKLAVEFQPGMTVITGETGAGKSISLDALSLALGARADSASVRTGADKTDIRAVFDIEQLTNVQQWLAQHDLADAGQECILRRVITSEGRSKAYINDQPVNLNTLKQLGDMLVDIHSQHAHHQLMRREHHQTLLDAYAQGHDLLKKTAAQFQQWQDSKRQIEQLQRQQQDAAQRKQFLQFQLEEFATLNLQEGEFPALEQRHAIASQADALKGACQQSLLLCRDHERHAVLDQLQQCQQALATFCQHSVSVREASELLDSAVIQIEEACQSLRHQLSELDSGNEDLFSLEQRLSEILAVARKNRVLPDQLPEVQHRLQQELDNLSTGSERLEALQHQAQQQFEQYSKTAEQLSKARQKACKPLEEQIHQQLASLGMSHCRFRIVLNSDKQAPKAHGFENAEFLISTNPAAEPQALARIASGGELSRISLAIQVVTAKASTIPVLIFDEVDVGIGGATAEVVGRLLQQLSQSAQIICVTHQAQVAAFADQHLFVTKQLLDGSMNTQAEFLDTAQKQQEIARMLGGMEITRATLDHAAEMLNRAGR